MVTTDEPTHEASPGHRMSLVTERSVVRRSPGSRLGWAFVLVPALLCGGVAMVAAPSVEDELVTRVESSLKAEKISGVKVSADGLFVTVGVPARVDGAQVRRIAEAVPGVATVSETAVFASKAERIACTNLDKKLNRATGNQRIPFVGRSTRLTGAGERMVKAAGKLVAACGTARVYVGGHTDDSTFDGSALSLRRARVMIKLMRRAGVPDERMLPRGYGAQYLVDRGDSPAARARNERGSIALEGS